MERRSFLALSSRLALGALATTGLSRVAAQRLVPVRLLVLRRPGLAPTTHCASPCIRGRLFDVSGLGDRALNETLIPLLETVPALCDVIERPWRNNAANVSSIPRGEYVATIRDDATKRWMTNENRRWRLELQATRNRTAIQFHYGEDVSWSEGCFVVGSLRQPGEASGITPTYCRLEGGEEAVARIRGAVLATGRNQNDIKIGVADHDRLFPDMTARSPC